VLPAQGEHLAHAQSGVRPEEQHEAVVVVASVPEQFDDLELGVDLRRHHVLVARRVASGTYVAEWIGLGRARPAQRGVQRARRGDPQLDRGGRQRAALRSSSALARLGGVDQRFAIAGTKALDVHDARVAARSEQVDVVPQGDQLDDAAPVGAMRMARRGDPGVAVQREVGLGERPQTLDVAFVGRQDREAPQRRLAPAVELLGSSERIAPGARGQGHRHYQTRSVPITCGIRHVRQERLRYRGCGTMSGIDDGVIPLDHDDGTVGVRAGEGERALSAARTAAARRR
jgi:hypothetical protein